MNAMTGKTVVLFLGPLFLFSQQANAQVKGSVEAYRMMVQREREQGMAAHEWNQAKKIGRNAAIAMSAERKSVNPLDPETMGTGAVGQLNEMVMKVIQVVDQKNLLLNTRSGQSIWLKDCDTNEIADDIDVVIVGYVRCSGTKSYSNTLGANRTVKVIEFITEAEQKAIDEANFIAQFKPFVLRNGRELKAKIAHVSQDKITLETMDGKQQAYLWTAFNKETSAKLPRRPESKSSKGR